jgi:NAD-dependent deacetylase
MRALQRPRTAHSSGAFARACGIRPEWLGGGRPACRGALAARPGWACEIARLTVLTGAGISTDSGIPDFRGPSGIWTKNPAAEKLSTYQAYMADSELRRRSWQNRLAHPAWAVEPNPAHLALARLARSTIDTQVITRNIDGLHQRAGTPPGRVIELHNTMFGVVCTGCGDRTAMADA